MKREAETGGLATGWADVALARSPRVGGLITAYQLLLVFAWHWTVFPGTLVSVDWLLGYGASSGGVPAQPGPFDILRVLGYFFHPLAATALLTVALVEGWLGWITLRLFTRRSWPGFGWLVQAWWRVCLWGVIGLPAVAIGFALVWREYDAAMTFPLIWVLCGIVGPTAMFMAQRHRYAPGCCRKCGYDLTGNVSGRCPECGEPIRVSSPRMRHVRGEAGGRARRRLTRRWRVVKWVGAVACVLCLATFWLASEQRFRCRPGARWLCDVSCGCVEITYSSQGWSPRARAMNQQVWEQARPPRLRDIQWSLQSVFERGLVHVRLPLWMPCAVVAVPTVFLWWRDRRFSKGRCQHCGSDLTGNVSGRCPECGTAITEKEART